MSRATNIQNFGNSRVVGRSDGVKELFLPTPSNLWINANPIDFIDDGGGPIATSKTVVNPNISEFFGVREVLWSVSSGNNIVVCLRNNARLGNRTILYNTSGGVGAWQTSNAPTSNSNYIWVKVIDGNIYTGGDNLMVSQDDGATWSVVFNSVILGIAKGNGVYIANSVRWNTVFPGAISTDGITFTNNSVTINHLDGSRDNFFTFVFNESIEFHNGLFYGFLTDHTHRTPDTNSIPKKYFTSSDGIVWTEQLTPISTRSVNNPIWVVNNILVDTPDYENNGVFYLNTGGGLTTQIEGDYTVAYENASDFGSGESKPIKDQWIHYADGKYWIGKNYGGNESFKIQFNSSEICTSDILTADSFFPIPIYSETDWYISSQLVHNNKYYAFERQTTQPIGDFSARSVSAITRLVRIDG